MKFDLTTPREAETLIARMFLDGGACSVEVREERAFKDDGWLALGTIDLYPASGGDERLAYAVHRGSFEWSLPPIEAARTALTGLLGLTSEAKDKPKLRRALDAIAAIPVRAGLQHPKFDPNAFEILPFRRSMTVVADTSGAVQGGLDFVARYLHPTARIKVPAIVQMEIVNFADRFLSGRRAARTRHPDLLIDHLMSQGGQRVLLRLELQAETEIERTFILGDPLRSAFQADNDPALRELNLSVAVRGYADRLILESARQHRAQANHGHQVQLLTSDQGLARMAMAEGIVPLFFSAVSAVDFFGRRLTGATLNPFNGTLHESSLASLLWELATAFGAAKLVSSNGAHSLHIAAIGEGLSWSPYQSHADLLWCDHSSVPSWPAPAPVPARSAGPDDAPKASNVLASNRKANPGKTRELTKPSGSLTKKNSAVSLPRLNVGTVFALVDELDNYQNMSIDHAIKVAKTKSKAALEEYRRFLVSAGFLSVDSGDWSATESASQLAIALRNEDVASLRHILSASPAYDLLQERIGSLSVGETWDPKEFTRALTCFRTMAEVTNIAMQIAGEGIYPTLNDASPKEFAKIALGRFADLNRGEGLVSTGAWLESLVRSDGIHPEMARARLGEASALGFLKRSTEGSTTDTRLDNHVFQALRVADGRPVIQPIHLYRGDYLIPGKSSTSLRIEGPST